MCARCGCVKKKTVEKLWAKKGITQYLLGMLSLAAMLRICNMGARWDEGRPIPKSLSLHKPNKRR